MSQLSHWRHILRMPPTLLITLVWIVELVVNVAVSSLNERYGANTLEVICTSSSGLLLSLALYGISRSLSKAGIRWQPAIIGAVAIAFGTLLWALNVLFQYWIGGHNADPNQSIFSRPGDFFVRLRLSWMYFADLFILQAVVFAFINNARALESRERQLVEAKLAALRFQLNPHFLFNTLNALTSLVSDHRSHEAEEMIARLSSFLRTSLSSEPTDLVSLGYELDTVQAYLDIESVRFGERLAVHYACAAGLRKAQVPSLILQPLVENAVKYAVAPSKDEVTITIEASVDNKDLILVVEDNGQHLGTTHPPSTGLGLRNVASRLDALYGDAGRIEAIRRERGFTAVIRLPYALGQA